MGPFLSAKFMFFTRILKITSKTSLMTCRKVKIVSPWVKIGERSLNEIFRFFPSKKLLFYELAPNFPQELARVKNRHFLKLHSRAPNYGSSIIKENQQLV